MNRPMRQLLLERLEDERSKRVIFVSHCLLNENTRYPGGAFRRGCVDELVDSFQQEGLGIYQMRCPELLQRQRWCMCGCMPCRLHPPDEIVSWLLESSNSSVRYFALCTLLGRKGLEHAEERR
jgi:hypothetical protein